MAGDLTARIAAIVQKNHTRGAIRFKLMGELIHCSIPTTPAFVVRLSTL